MKLEEALKPLKRVHELNIDSHWGYESGILTHKGLKAVARALQRLRPLEAINLNFKL